MELLRRDRAVCRCSYWANSQPSLNHPQPQCLTTERYPMNLAQLLGRQSRAKIPIPLANQYQRCSPQRLGLAPVAATTSSLRDQARWTLGPEGLQQPEHLAALESQQLRRCRRRQSLLIQIPQQLEPRQLPIAHQPNRHPQHPPEIPREVSSLIGRGVTF
jgi:hypothetical protein